MLATWQLIKPQPRFELKNVLAINVCRPELIASITFCVNSFENCSTHFDSFSLCFQSFFFRFSFFYQLAGSTARLTRGEYPVACCSFSFPFRLASFILCNVAKCSNIFYLCWPFLALLKREQKKGHWVADFGAHFLY